MNTFEKLAALRRSLLPLGLAGFIVPRADEFQGEYVPPGSERLAWLTGFTGSAGMAIVLAARAVVMSDGRYAEQLKAEVPADLFALADSTKVSAAQWLGEQAPAGAVIGYDPRLHTVKEIAALEKSLGRKKIALRALEANPLDALWTGRPPAPASRVEIFPEAIAGRGAAEKRAALAAALAEAGGLAAVIALPESVAWLFNIRGDDVPHTPVALSTAIVAADGAAQWFIAPARVGADVLAQFGADVQVRDPAALEEALKELAARARAEGKPLLMDFARTPVWFKAVLEKAGVAVEDFEDPCIVPRACKTAAERAGIVAAHLRDAVALARCLHWLDTEAARGNLTELDVVAKLRGFRALDPAFRDDSFDTIAGWGAHGAIVHYRPTAQSNATIEPPGLLLLDSGGQYRDGTTDVTRTIAIGEPTAEMRENFTLVLKGHIAIAAARFPEGTTGMQLDALARRALWDAGRDYDHGTGHGVGCYLSVHEEAAGISKRPGRAVMPGMLISNEPGFYKTGAYGIRIENLVLAREDGAREGTDIKILAFDTVTLAPIDRRLTDAALLETRERDWLNEYHARVFAAVGPLVEEGVRTWLKKATAPL